MLRGVLQDGTYTVLVADCRRSGWGDGATVGAWSRLVERHGGVDVGESVSGSSVAFRSAGEAVRCAVAVQEAQRPVSELALGVHAGEVHTADGAEAVVVQQAARLARLAASGQILASALVRQLIAEDADLRFGEDREVSLPGLAGRMVVTEVRWGEHRNRVLRVVIADDAALVRDGVAALLRAHGVEVVGTASDSEGLHEEVARRLPDVALVDIRMPPTFTDEGLVAAERIRARFPEVGVLVLSQHLDTRYALRVAHANPARTGYLLKDRVTDSRVLFDALERIADGGCVIDAAVAEGLVTRASALARIDELTEREHLPLALVAEGRSNRAIAEILVVTPKTVETHIGQIFLKLDLRAAEGEDRRVAAVLAYLQASSTRR